jgi:radical SAM protein with 4Fe4S-binding SPASM domain
MVVSQWPVQAARPKSPMSSPRKLICHPYCAYYKSEAKEEMACGGLTVLAPLLEAYPEIIPVLAMENATPFNDPYPYLFHHLLCRHCDFFIDGCDFTDPEFTKPAPPCGGYVAADALLQRSPAHESILLEALTPKDLPVTLDSKCTLKQLESPYLYHIGRDELYELDEKSFAFLRKCDGNHLLADLSADMAFLDFCLQEGLLCLGSECPPPAVRPAPSPIPSLRYLEMQLTSRCNLRCRHCYLGEPKTEDLPLASALSALDEFERMQGLRVLVSGGEPLLHPDFSQLSKALPRFQFRKVLLTNGTLVREENQELWEGFDEIQFSLDGLQTGHEALRGPGTYAKALKGIETAQAKNIPISIATMVHSHNLKDFARLADLVADLGAIEWSIDVPCTTGRLSAHPELSVPPEQGAPFLRYAFGGSYHGAEEAYACGYHLCTVSPQGNVLKCGFFDETPLGTLKEGLETSWKRARHLPLSELACSQCPHILECKGGCRYRAKSPLGKDPVMCALYGVE